VDEARLTVVGEPGCDRLSGGDETVLTTEQGDEVVGKAGHRRSIAPPTCAWAADPTPLWTAAPCAHRRTEPSAQRRGRVLPPIGSAGPRSTRRGRSTRTARVRGRSLPVGGSRSPRAAAGGSVAEDEAHGL